MDGRHPRRGRRAAGPGRGRRGRAASWRAVVRWRALTSKPNLTARRTALARPLSAARATRFGTRCSVCAIRVGSAARGSVDSPPVAGQAGADEPRDGSTVEVSAPASASSAAMSALPPTTADSYGVRPSKDGCKAGRLGSAPWAQQQAGPAGQAVAAACCSASCTELGRRGVWGARRWCQGPPSPRPEPVGSRAARGPRCRRWRARQGHSCRSPGCRWASAPASSSSRARAIVLPVRWRQAFAPPERRR